MEQGKSLSRKIALITLSEPWSFIRQIQVLETQRTEGAYAAWSRLLSQKAENPFFQSCAFLPSFSAFQVVCPDHRGHSLRGWGIWIWGRMSWKRWSSKTLWVGTKLAPFQRAKGILVNSSSSLWLESDPIQPPRASNLHREAGRFHFRWLEQVDQGYLLGAGLLPPTLSFPFCLAGSWGQARPQQTCVIQDLWSRTISCQYTHTD